MSERMVQYNILKRDAEADKALYDGLLTKLKEAGISAALQSSNIRVVDPAMIPSYPSRPAKARNVALAFLVGLVGGIGLAHFARIHGQHRQDARRHRDARPLAFPRGGSRIRGFQRRWPPKEDSE